MKLNPTSETFNLGDTSFRRQTLIDDYKKLLPYLVDVNATFDSWNNDAQATFYKNVLHHSDLFERAESEDFAKRGRTLTNALVKIGMVNENRKLSEVAINWLDNKILRADKIERILGTDINNIVFLRQLLKLRVYDSDGIHYFYPFRVALALISEYRNIPQQNFLILIHSIKPNMSDDMIKQIIKNYSKVDKNNLSFLSYIEKEFSDVEEYRDVDNLFNEYSLDKEKFNKIFVNRKSSDSQEIYYEFIKVLLRFKAEKTNNNLKELLRVSKDLKIKKAFGFGKSVFIEEKNVEDFLNYNKNNLLLSDNNQDIYVQFISSKKHDLIKEYADMTKRTFNLTGLLDYSNGLVNAVNQDVIKIIFFNMQLAGEGDYNIYDKNLESDFYKDISLIEIISLQENEILEKLQHVLNVNDSTELEKAVVLQKEKRFRELIDKEFPKQKIIELLPLFSERNDDEIRKQVSESANVPTIYEYIVAIAWYHISKEDFYITESLNLTLDGNMKPLSHAAGGDGDIIINYNDLILMLEVTLMNKQAQKRGEWEPVLRHATNLTVDACPKDVITLFIADELDENTINIWHAVARVPLKSSNKDKYADQVKIFPLLNTELIDMLQNNKDEVKLLKSINSMYKNMSTDFDVNWRDEVLNG